MVSHTRRGKISTEISTDVENPSRFCLRSLYKAYNGCEKRRKRSTFISGFQPAKPDTFCKASMLNFKFSKEQRNAAEDIPAKQSPARKDAWLQGSDEDTWRPARVEGEER